MLNKLLYLGVFGVLGTFSLLWDGYTSFRFAASFLFDLRKSVLLYGLVTALFSLVTVIGLLDIFLVSDFLDFWGIWVVSAFWFSIVSILSSASASAIGSVGGGSCIT